MTHAIGFAGALFWVRGASIFIPCSMQTFPCGIVYFLYVSGFVALSEMQVPVTVVAWAGFWPDASAAVLLELVVGFCDCVQSGCCGA